MRRENIYNTSHLPQTNVKQLSDTFPGSPAAASVNKRTRCRPVAASSDVSYVAGLITACRVLSDDAGMPGPLRVHAAATMLAASTA